MLHPSFIATTPTLHVPLFQYSQQGVLYRAIGHKSANFWGVGRLEHRRGLPSLTRHPSPAFYLRVLVEIQTRILRPLLILPTSSMRSKRTSVKSSSTLKYTPLLITGDPQASAAMRAPALVAMETKSTILLTLVSPPAMRGKDCISRVKNGKWFRSEVCIASFW